MNKRLSFIVIGAVSLLFSGCIATQDDVRVLKTQVAALNKTLQDLQKNQAEAGTQMEDLTVQLTRSGENLKDFDYKLDDLSTKLDNIVSMLSKQNGEFKAMLPGDIYAEAKKQYDAAQYSQAAQGFALYIKDAAEGSNIQEAYLYGANSLYEVKEYQKAAVLAATLLENFPKSQYTADARITYAKSILPLDKKTEAATYLKSVVQDFKNTPQADTAKKLLEGIK